MASVPRRVSKFLPRLTRPAFGARGFHQATVLTDWPAIVGSRIAARSCPEKIAADGTLSVRVSGAFALELQHLEPVVLERIAAHFGYRAITRLAIRQGPLPDRTDKGEPDPPVQTEEPGPDQRLEGFEDSGLRSALAALGRALRSRPGRGGGPTSA